MAKSMHHVETNIIHKHERGEMETESVLSIEECM